MVQTLNTFSFEGSAVRTIVIEGKPWFVASDVARILGYTNPTKAVRDHCRSTNETFVLTSTGEKKVNIIREGDVFRLILRSKLPAAQAFEAWVMDEVLPAIAQTGTYPAATQPALSDLQDQIAGLRTVIESRSVSFKPSEKLISDLRTTELALASAQSLMGKALDEISRQMKKLGIHRVGESKPQDTLTLR